MFRNGVSRRSVPGNRSPTGIAVRGSSAYPGGAIVTVSISTADRTVAPTTAPAASDRPALVLEVGLDRNGDGEDERGDEIEDRGRAGARVVVPALGQQREDAGEQQAQREAVAKARPAEQERRPETQPAGRPDGAGQVPRAVQALVPAAEPRQRLRARRDAVEQHAEAPDELEAATTLAPLVEQRDAEDEREDRGDGGEDDRGVHGSARLRPGRAGSLVGGDEAQQQPVEERGRVAVEGRQAGRIQRATPAEPGQLGEEGLARRDELRDRLGQAASRPPPCDAPGRPRSRAPRLRGARASAHRRHRRRGKR